MNIEEVKKYLAEKATTGGGYIINSSDFSLPVVGCILLTSGSEERQHPVSRRF